MVYDPDLDDNLEKHLSEIGVTKDSSITITDESDATENGDQPRVNLVLSVIAANSSPESTISGGEPPLRLTETFEIKRKPPKPIEPTPTAQASKAGQAEKNAMAKMNGHAANGEAVEVLEEGVPMPEADNEKVAGEKRKRGNEDAAVEGEMARKRGRVMEERPLGRQAKGADVGVGVGGGEVEMVDGPGPQAEGAVNGQKMGVSKGMSKGKGAQGPEGADAAFVVDDDGGAIVIDD